MRQLTKSDIKIIEDTAKYYYYTRPYARTIRTISLKSGTFCVVPTNNNINNWREIRAEFNPTNTNISLSCRGVDFNGTPCEEVITFLMSMLVHEATHAVTRTEFEQAAINEAVRRASQVGTSCNYSHYITHPVELVAHGAMVASDVYRSIGLLRIWWAFRLAARKTQSLDYIRCQLKGIGWFRSWRILNKITNSAWATYRSWR